jgi:hypothetical protein
MVDGWDFRTAWDILRAGGGVASLGSLATALGVPHRSGDGQSRLAAGRAKVAALVLKRVLTLDFDQALWDGTEIRLVDRGSEPKSGHHGLFGEASP